MLRSPFSPCGRRWPSEARSDEGFRAGATHPSPSSPNGSAPPRRGSLSSPTRGEEGNPGIGVTGRSGDAALPLLPLWEKVSPSNVPARSRKRRRMRGVEPPKRGQDHTCLLRKARGFGASGIFLSSSYPRPFCSPYPEAVPPMGTPIMTVIAWGGTGASASR